MKYKLESDSASALIKKYLLKIYYLRYFYIGSVLFLFICAILINKFSRKEYRVNATVGPAQENRSQVLASNNMFTGLGRSYNTGNGIDAAINSLNSFSLISSTISEMNLEVGYFKLKKGLFSQNTELYKKSPFSVNMDKSHIQAIGTKFYITPLSDSTFKLSAANNKTYLYNYIDNKIVGKDIVFDIDTICKFNTTITNKYFEFSISNDKNFLSASNSKKERFYFIFYYTEGLAKLYLSNLKVEPVSYLASIIELQFSDSNIDKSIDFLNTYINAFLNENLAKKNQVAINTINFIESQISEISDSLVISESKLRNYRSSNQVMDLSFQGQKSYEQMAQLDKDKTSLELQKNYYNYVINLFKTNQDMSGVVPPSSANITDPILNKLITDLIALNVERSGIVSKNQNEKNIFLAEIDSKIKTQKQTIIENVTNNLNSINLSLNELSYRKDKLSKEIANLPKTEMNMVNIQRKFNVNDAIFTYFLQKRSEAAISLASNYPDYELLEPAREITSKIVKPKILMNYILALFLGLLIPTIYLVIKDLVNNKISGVSDIEHIISKSAFGIIYSNPKKYEAVVAESPKSAIAESFRNLRSNLFLKLRPLNSKIIMVTSSQPRDGKSFISFNLAASIASVGFKTIIIDCDLRRPTLHTKFNQDNTIGISNFMINKAKEEDIIHDTSVENLFFIPTGPLLPNPSELIDSGILDDLITSLKSRFEFIIIDSPPLGLVADSLQLVKYASQILVVSRNNTTRKDILINALSLLDTNKIDNYEVILNDLDIEKSPYSEYKKYYLKE